MIHLVIHLIEIKIASQAIWFWTKKWFVGLCLSWILVQHSVWMNETRKQFWLFAPTQRSYQNLGKDPGQWCSMNDLCHWFWDSLFRKNADDKTGRNRKLWISNIRYRKTEQCIDWNLSIDERELLPYIHIYIQTSYVSPVSLMLMLMYFCLCKKKCYIMVTL